MTTIDQLAKAAELEPLYRLMGEIKALAPWEFMDESQMFGIQRPDSDITGYVSVMGTLGEHIAISVYLGDLALSQFRQIEISSVMSPEALLATRQVQASFEDRDMLDKRDREIIKVLGLKYRGAQTWVMFRSYLPAYAPWYIDSDEAQWLRTALEQLLVMAPRVRADPSILPDFETADYLIRIPQASGDTLNWREEIRHIDSPTQHYEGNINQQSIDDLAALKRSKNLSLEIDVSLLLIVDHRRGDIIDFTMIDARPSLDKLWSSVPNILLERLAALPERPKSIRMRHPLLLGVMRMLEKKLDIKILETPALVSLDMARHFMIGSAFGGAEPMW